MFLNNFLFQIAEEKVFDLFSAVSWQLFLNVSLAGCFC